MGAHQCVIGQIAYRLTVLLDNRVLNNRDSIVYPKNYSIQIKNKEYLRSLNRPVLEIKAKTMPNVIDNIDEVTGLLNVLNIAIGCRIMLTYNIGVEVGLANAPLETF